MNRPLNLRQLQHAVLLADERHFARAAERAFLSQPAFNGLACGRDSRTLARRNATDRRD